MEPKAQAGHIRGPRLFSGIGRAPSGRPGNDPEKLRARPCGIMIWAWCQESAGRPVSSAQEFFQVFLRDETSTYRMWPNAIARLQKKKKPNPPLLKTYPDGRDGFFRSSMHRRYRALLGCSPVSKWGAMLLYLRVVRLWGAGIFFSAIILTLLPMRAFILLFGRGQWHLRRDFLLLSL